MRVCICLFMSPVRMVGVILFSPVHLSVGPQNLTLYFNVRQLDTHVSLVKHFQTTPTLAIKTFYLVTPDVPVGDMEF